MKETERNDVMVEIYEEEAVDEKALAKEEKKRLKEEKKRLKDLEKKMQ